MNLIHKLACFIVLITVAGLSQTSTSQMSPPQSSSTQSSSPQSSSPQSSKTGGPYQKEATTSEAGGVVRIAANSPRPLAQVLDALQKKYGWSVNYEDPQYMSSVEVSATSGAADRQRVPTGGNFNVDLPANASDEEKTLRIVVDAYNHSKNPGQFELRTLFKNQFAVVGTGDRDEKGAVSKQPVPLDVNVILPSEDRTLNDALDLLCQEITKQAQMDITVGVLPRKLFLSNRAKIGGRKIAARELLMQILAATHHDLYWRLYYDPSSNGYFLSIHSVQLSRP